MAYDAAAGGSPYEGLDVERVFAAVELLAERRTLEVSPFVSAWHPAVDAWDRPGLPPFFDRKLKHALGERGRPRGVQDLLVNLIRGVTGEGTGGVYKQLAERMIQELQPLVVTDPEQTGYRDKREARQQHAE